MPSDDAYQERRQEPTSEWDSLGDLPFAEPPVPYPPDPSDPDFPPAAPPWKGPPHPGFWFSALWSVGMLIVAQIVPAMGIMIGYIALRAATSPEPRKTVQALTSPQGMEEIQRATLMTMFACSQLILVLLSLLLIRLTAGPDWRRQLGLRLPSVAHLVLVVLGIPALWVVANGTYGVFKGFFPPFSQLPALLIANGAVVWLITLAVWFAWLAGFDVKRAIRTRSVGEQMAVVAMIGTAAVVCGWGVYTVIKPYVFEFHLPGSGAGMMEKMVQEFRTWPWPLAVLIIGLGPGLGEELWCRGFLGRGLLGHFGVVSGILLASFFFGWIHLEPHQGPMAALMGVALHYTYVTTRSFWVPVLIHALNNSLSVVASRLGGEAEKVDTAPEEIPYRIYATAVALLLIVGWALYRSRARVVGPDGRAVPEHELDYPGVALPRPNQGTLVVPRWSDWATAVLLAGAFSAFAVAFYLESGF